MKASVNGAGGRPLAIIFDWDNTLVDSWSIIHDAMNHTLTSFDHPPWTLEQTKGRVRRSMRDSFPELFGRKWQEAADIFYERFENSHLQGLAPLPEIEEMLAELAALEVPMAVLSNKRGDFLRREAAHLGLAGFFKSLIGATDGPADKPAPQAVRLALAGIDVTPGPQVWFVGDADIDLECAAKAGCVAVLLRQTPPRAEEFPDHPPALYFADGTALSKRCASL